MIKNNKMKIAIVFILFIMVMPMFLSCRTYAKMIDESYVENDPWGPQSISYNQLAALWELLCTDHIQHIPSENDVRYAKDGGSTIDTTLLGNDEWTYNRLYGHYYQSEELAYYADIEDKICPPKAAYILNHIKENEGGYPCPVQVAWWTTKENVGNVHPEDNELAAIGTAYQDFVKKIAKDKEADIEDTSKYKPMTHTFEDGKTVEIMFPETDVPSTIEFDTSKATVSFDEKRQKWIAGPYNIKYVDDSFNSIDFGLLDKFDIYTDASTEPLKDDEWRFIFPKEKQDKEKKYPASKEPFYIELNYKEKVTKITGIDVDYKYLVAGGKYQKLSGTYDKIAWTCTRTCVASGSCSDKEHSHKWSYHLKAEKQNLDLKSQVLAVENMAARWYEIEKVSIKLNQSTLKIEKKALDENGNELSADEVKDRFGKNQYFDFKVKISHSDGRVENSVVTVKAGSTATVGTYGWTDKQTPPTYEIQEVSTPSDTSWEAKSISSSSGTLAVNQTITATAVNQIKYKRNKIQISKTVSSPAEKDETFKFSVDVTMPNGKHDVSTATIVVKQGKKTGKVWTSKEYTWGGKQAPTYEITEIETEDSKKYTPSITPSKGKLDGSGSAIKVNALNGSAMSYLTVEKAVRDGQTTDDTFDFKIRVDGVKNTDSGTVEFEVYDVKAGEKIGPYGFEWKDAKAPTYRVEEINMNSDSSVDMIEEIGSSKVEKGKNYIEGTLVKNKETNLTAVKFTNNVNKHQGNIKVIKKFFSSEKMTAEELKELASQLNVEFDVEVTIEGTFVYGGETIQNSSKVIKQTLSAANGWEFTIDNVVWYGAETPTYTVKEVSLPDKWVCRSMDYSYTENESTDTPGHNLLDGGTVEVTIVNEIPSDTEIDLTFEMSGLVWVDGILDQKNDDKYYNSPNGVYDEGEPLKENAEVTVYKVIYDGAGNVVERNVATAYQDDQGNEITFPIITKSDGKWDVPRIGVPGVEQEGYSASYDVEFAYDGQTYETVAFLEKSNGDAGSFINATTAAKKDYANNSMAIEVSNNSKNIAEVSGKTAINANGDTTGYVGLKDGTQAEISYSSANAGTAYPTISRLNTSNPYDGRVLDLFKATATTSAGGLTFPFDVDGYDGSALTEVNKTIDDSGFHTKYKFLAVYNYCLHINLGLKEREAVDVGLTKNLTEAKVVVNERMYQYKYSGYYDLTEENTDLLDKDIYVEDSTKEIKYTLGLYQSDYYYRAEMYNRNNPDLYNRLKDFYATLDKDLSDTELDIYLTYQIKLQNTSSSYNVQINSLDDYYDSSFTLIREPQKKYLKTQTIGGEKSDVNKEVTVAEASSYAGNWSKKDRKTRMPGSDMDEDGNNIIYNKMTATNLGIVLEPGRDETLTLTFKVNKTETQSGIKNAIILGQKCNVAEIASYSVFNKETGELAGKIDRDSAPSNVNLPVYNTKPWYEDDTFGAPRIKVNLVGDGVDRNINGVVWEDNSNGSDTKIQENPDQRYNQWIGNGKKDSGEKEIEGLTTQLVQKIPVQNEDGTYTEYEYIWPTDEAFDFLGGASLEQITGFDTTTKTGEKGKYNFKNIIAGDYVVRFIYGDQKIDSADYSVAKAYNGQDYKSSKFKGKLENGDELQADSYLDINTYLDAKEDDERLNTAIDSEIERLKVVQKSREITYGNSSVMANFEENSALYTDYTMFADTPKIDMNIELPTFKHDDNGKNEVNKDYTYTVKNVDFGVEERPITEITLDKQIEEIILTTSDGNNIMDAKYTIDYDVDEHGKVKAKVELDSANSYGVDNLQALNRDQATTRGFRYISIDTSILEGTTITVKYRFTVLNTGEVDRTGELANMIYANDNTEFPNTITELSGDFATYRKVGDSLENTTPFGKYLGNIYYYGTDGAQSDAVVTSTVRQLVDYVDNSVVFSGNRNNFENSSWSNITTEELKGHIDPEIINQNNNKLIDSKGIEYETQNRNNLIVSVDSTESTLNNKGFIVELLPFAADKTQDKTDYRKAMNLTVTKYVGSDSDDLQIDNVAEIIKYNNKVGRRDELSIAGDQNPATAFEKTVGVGTPETVSAGMPYQRDTSASEMITLSPPFGSGLSSWKLQVIGTIAVSLVVVAGGIVVIKKKILR